MRIISGKFKHRIITKSVPAGVRPTTDQARETIFNILAGSIEWDGARVLDLCAGTGALGFEALSRGAAFCDFVEINRTTAGHIDTTAKSLHLTADDYRVHTVDSVLFVRELDDTHLYSVVFTDPPYHKKLLNSLLRILIERSVLHEDGIVVAEHDISEVLILPENVSVFSTRIFGTTVVDFMEIGRI